MRRSTIRLLCALLLLVCVPWGAAQAMSQSDAENYKASHPGSTLTWCGNIGKICDCNCTGTKPEGLPDSTQQSDGKWCSTVYKNSGSWIDELTYSHIHLATDYTLGRGRAPGGCQTCGSIQSLGLEEAGLTPLEFQRYHRFRNMTQRSSFGPGVFCSYDITMQIAHLDGGAWQAIITDPSLQAPLLLTDSGGGLFKGAGWNKIQGLRFYTGPQGTGTAVADPSLALSAVLTTFKGYRYTFDVFNPYGTIPSPWAYGEIGSVAVHGTAGYAGGTFSLSASGADIWNTADAFGYVYQGVQGDVTITAEVTSLATYRGLAADSTNPWAKVGVMLREGLDANARTVNLCLSNSNGVVLQSRLTPGAAMAQVAQIGGVSAPRYVRLQRQGSLITGFVSADGATWQTVGSQTVAMNAVVFAGLSLTSHNNGVLSAASFTNVAVTGTPAPPASWPVPTTAPFTAATLAGRLTGIVDRNGYGVAIAYTSWTPTQLQQSPDLAWQISTVTDPHGRQLAFTYGATQVGGRWVVTSVKIPNGATVSYSYAGGLLTGVTLPDGTTSSFTYTPDAATNTTVVAYDDAGADGYHRRKQASLTNLFTTLDSQPTYQIFNQASNLISMLVNGANEVSLLTFPVNGLSTRFYEGNGVIKEVTKLSAALQVRYLNGWTFDPVNGLTNVTTESSPTLLQYANDNMYRQGSASQTTSDTGVVTTITNDADGYPVKIAYSDGTTEKYSYNGFKQVTRYEDRLHRVTLSTYDAQGNLTLTEVGILYVAPTGDVHQPEYAAYQKIYFPAGDPNQFLLQADIDANGNRTSYTYTTGVGTGGSHLLATITTPNDAGTGTITAWTFTYDSIGRKTSSTDAVGRATYFAYDARDRLVKTTYSDSSTEIVVYGTGADKNLVHLRKDRQGALTEYSYDSAGRCTVTTMGANTMSADGSTITPSDPTQVATQSLVVQTVCTFLDGTELKAGCTTNGNLVTYGYDYRQRLVSSTAYPTSASPGLTTTNQYSSNNLLAQVTDPYGRSTYSVYRPSDVQLIRTVQGLVPADGVGGPADAATIARASTPSNPPYLVTDYTLDAVGQRVAVIDPRSITSTITYDSRGRVTQTVEASSDAAVAATMQLLYDAQSNVLAVRSPRYAASGDVGGYQKAQTTKTYTHRNLLLTQTAAPGQAETGTQSFTYYDDGRLQTRADENGGAWTTVWMQCCARIGSQSDPAVADVAPAPSFQGVHVFDYDAFGDQTQEYVVKLPAGSQLPGCCDGSAPTGTVVSETTTAYDIRHRPIFRTVWLQPLGAIDANNPPIAGQNGIPSSQGLTTSYRYDDNLADGLGLSNPSDPNSVAPYLAGLNFGAAAVGSAQVTINPAGEPSWTISDGLGRVVRIVDGNGNATTTTFDTVDGAGLVDITVADALGHATTQAMDAAGRVRTTTDQLGQVATFAADADGNAVAQRDPNGVGQDCVFDSRNRRTQCTDTQGDATSQTYDADSNVVSATDGLHQVTTFTFDARDRKVAVTDRLGGVTRFAYDPVSNLVQITDAQSAVTSYRYEARNLLLAETYPPGQATPGSPTTPPLDQRSYTYDAAHRLLSRLDQIGVLTSYVYDLAGRLTSRMYGDGQGNDAFGYDAASRVVTATNGRYGTTVTRSYTQNAEKAGRMTSETQTAPGTTETMAYSYDAANRLVAVTYPNGSPVARTFTNRNQLASVSYAGSAIAGPITYDNGMRRTALPLGNGLTETRTYRADNLIASIQVPGVTGFSYGYNADKDVTLETNGLFPAENEDYAYDAENRVTLWHRDGIESQQWSLSLVGDWNATTRTGPQAFSQTRTHSAAHEITQIAVGGGPTVALAYDAKGNLQSAPGMGLLAQWDDENRLAATVVGPSVSTYAYDAFGRRLQKTAGGLVTTYVHDGAQAVAEYTAPVYQSQDIGSPTLAGSFSDNGAGTVTLAGSGADVWGTSDQFRFAYRSLTGDGSITARVTSQGNTHVWAKAGVMIRATLDPASAHAFLCVTPGNGEDFQRRTAAGGVSTGNQTGPGTGTAPYWVRLVRVGTTLTGYRSADGVSWSQMGTDTVAMPTTVYIGLAVCAHTNSTLSTATFTNVATSGAVASTAAATLARSYIYGSYIDEPVAEITSAGPCYVHGNRRYSVAALTGPDGAVLERCRYDAYGQRTVLAADGVTTVPVSSVGNQVGFTGLVLDQETGLYNARTRMYAPVLGRFLERDQVDYESDWNTYLASFVPNDTDPSGRKDCSKAINPKTATVYSGDVDHVGNQQSVGANKGSLQDVVDKAGSQLGACDCLSVLILIAHGNESGLYFKGREKSDGAWRDKGTGGLDSNILSHDSAAAFGAALKALCFCKPCQIYMLGCNSGQGKTPQDLANATGCTVYAPNGYCWPNPADPGKSKVKKEIPKGEPHYPNGLPPTGPNPGESMLPFTPEAPIKDGQPNVPKK